MFKIFFSSSVNPHSRRNRSRSAVGNWSFDFLPGVRISSRAFIIVTTSQSLKYQLHKIFGFFVQAVYSAELPDGCSHVNTSFFLSVYKDFDAGLTA